MTKLKDIYPLYLANEAKQPNADLEVTDKYTGKVAFRCAQADAATIDAGIAAAVEAAGADGADGELRAAGGAPALRRALHGALRRARLRALRRGRQADQGFAKARSPG